MGSLGKRRVSFSGLQSSHHVPTRSRSSYSFPSGPPRPRVPPYLSHAPTVYLTHASRRVRCRKGRRDGPTREKTGEPWVGVGSVATPEWSSCSYYPGTIYIRWSSGPRNGLVVDTSTPPTSPGGLDLDPLGVSEPGSQEVEMGRTLG